MSIQIDEVLATKLITALSMAADTADRPEARELLAQLSAQVGQARSEAHQAEAERAKRQTALAAHFRRVSARATASMEETSERLASQLQAGGGLNDSALTSLLKAQADAKIYGRFAGASTDDQELVQHIAQVVCDLRRQVRWGSQSTDSLTRAISDYDHRAMFEFIESWGELADA